MANCWICTKEADKWTHPAARMCSECWERSTDGLRALDFGFVSDEKQQTLEVEAPPFHAPTMQLVFRAESYGSILRKLVKKELQLGRQNVDDQVYFELASEDDLPALRGFEAAELMATLSTFGAVEISDGRALVHIADKKTDVELISCLTASLLHFLASRQPS